jgi:hypothetical protein
MLILDVGQAIDWLVAIGVLMGEGAEVWESEVACHDVLTMVSFSTI